MANELFERTPLGWHSSTLGEICERGGGMVQTGPFGSQLHASDYVPEGVPSIMPVNIGDNRVMAEGIARVREQDAQRLERHRVRKGDIVYSRRGDVERRALIRDDEAGWLCGTGCLLVRLGSRSAMEARFASYYLGHPAVREWIVRHAVGATMPNLNTGILSAVPVLVPPPEEQRSISALLGALDDKIDLNRRMNETLEAMARALFKAWFVDFDPVRARARGRTPALMDAETAALFPDGLEAFESGEKPRGWAHRPLYDCAGWVNGAAYRDFQFCEQGEGLPIVKIAELKAGITSQTKFTLTNPGDKYLIDTGDVLFSWSGNPDTSIDTFVWSRGKAWLNQHIFKVVTGSRPERTFVLWLLRHLRPVFAEIARNKQTTGLGHVTAGDMRRLNVAVPEPVVLKAFDKMVGPIGDLMLARDRENVTLERLRGELLPKLLSGELRVRDADLIVERAV